MSKAMLVFDMPESCAECSLESEYSECMAHNKEDVGWYVMNGLKPEWCPLVPMPKKKSAEFRTGICADYEEGYSDGKISGWNACIDTLGGGIDGKR